MSDLTKEPTDVQRKMITAMSNRGPIIIARTKAETAAMRLTRLYLSRRECAWCGTRLDRNDCGAIYEKCTPETRGKRRQDCLSHYKPRVAAAPSRSDDM